MANKTNEPSSVKPTPVVPDNSKINRDDFPKDFVFGTATSAFQVEGGATDGGKGFSIWDCFSTMTPSNIHDGSNGNEAADMYNRFEEDLRTMKAMGFDAYRFSISWPRILPGGRCSHGVNRQGIEYYNKLIDTVIAHGMKPYVTLFHWDLPQILELEYGGFLSRKVVPDFVEYAEVCFWQFGDRVKVWTTINEPWTVTANGYVTGNFPPGKPSCPPNKCHKKIPMHRCDVQAPDHKVELMNQRFCDCQKDPNWNPAKDPYTVARNLLLCHAHAVNLYRTKFQEFQNGKIGIVLNSHWFVPYNNKSTADEEAAKRAIDFMGGWFLEPVLKGRYPQRMIDSVPKENLAPFTDEESKMLAGSTDYVGFNYYTTNYVSDDPDSKVEPGYQRDMKLQFHTCSMSGELIGEPTGSPWLFIVPWGIYEHLVYFKKTYPDIPPIIITENGISDANDPKLTALEACRDPKRTKSYQDHLANILKAINDDKVDVRGYFAWSWCDNFEWDFGYLHRFGITYIDFVNNRTRYPKDSSVWFAKFLKGKKKA